MSVDLLEAIWILSNVVAIVVTVMSMLEARQDLHAARESTSPTAPAQILTASGNVRREAHRIIANGLLLSLVLPGLFIDRTTQLSWFVAVLMAVPLVLLSATLLDRRERWQLDNLLQRALQAEPLDPVALERSVQQVKALTEKGIEHAEAAYIEANSVNLKIADLKTELLRTLKVTEDAVEAVSPANGDLPDAGDAESSSDVVVEVDDPPR